MDPTPDGTGRLLPYRLWEAEVVLRAAGWIAAVRGSALLFCFLLAPAGWGSRRGLVFAGMGGVVYAVSGLALHFRARWGWFGCFVCSLSWCAFLGWVGFATHNQTLVLVGLPDLWKGVLLYLLAAPALFPEMVILVALISPSCRQALWQGDPSAELAVFRTVRGKRLSARVLAAWAALLVAHVSTAAALFLAPGCFAV